MNRNRLPVQSPLSARARVRAAGSLSPLWWMMAAVLALVFALAPGARAQGGYPRVGLSIAPDHYQSEIDIEEGEPFTVYACVFGPDDGTPLDFALNSVSWVIHQVCCGSAVQVVNVEWSDEFDHVGHPILGVTSTAKECMVRDRVLLATITAILYDPVPGGGLWAAGPYDASYQCGGELALFEGMPIMVHASSVTAVEAETWGGVKALYR